MLLDEENRLKPTPGRSLFNSTTGWSPDAPDKLKLRPMTVPYSEPAPRTAWVAQSRPAARTSARAVTERVKTAKVPKREKPERSYTARDKGATDVLELRAKGLKIKQIAAALGISHSQVGRRLYKYHLAHPETVRPATEALACQCGRPKMARNPTCATCRKNKRRREERLVRRGVVQGERT